jgi:hypothetical protein
MPSGALERLRREGSTRPLRQHGREHPSLIRQLPSFFSRGFESLLESLRVFRHLALCLPPHD